MMKIYAKYSTGDSTDEINKENTNEFWIFIANQKWEKYITYNEIRQINLIQVLVEWRTSREK